jgi:FkbH-like protein
MEKQNLSYYLEKSKIINKLNYEKKIRIAFLGSYTINGIPETLQVICAENDIDCETFISNYNQYFQDILNPQSDLYKFLPDISFLLLDTRTILNKYFFNPYTESIEDRKIFIQEKINELSTLISKFKNSQSKLVITNLSIPTYSPYGIFENKTEYGLKDMVLDFNSKLSQLVFDSTFAYVLDFNNFVTYFGEKNIFNYKNYFFGDIKISFDLVPEFVGELMKYIFPILGLNKKCIVLDLDNTIWGGIVGEDGLDGISLGPTPPGNAYVEFQRILLSLQKRGIILAINSKNNFDDAIEVIRNHPHMVLQEKDFTIMKINWNEKSDNLKQISSELNIGLDSLVFFDDDPINQEQVKKLLPEVMTIDLPKDPTLYSQSVQRMNFFDVLKITDEDKKRNIMYKQDQHRKDFSKTTLDLDSFLNGLDIKLTFLPANKSTVPRISQLTLKTNQFNLTTNRYQESDIEKFITDKNFFLMCVNVEDKFGDNGITGTFIIKKNGKTEWILDTFLLSCRVMGRKIETAILFSLLAYAKKCGVKTIIGKYIPTKKNEPIKNFLSEHGFKQDGESWKFDLTTKIRPPKHIQMVNNIE